MDECQADSHDKQHTGHRLLLQDEAVAASEGLWDRILCILFYDGSVKDCAINYILTALSLLACVMLLQMWQQEQHHASITSEINPSGTNSSADGDDAAGAAATTAPSTSTDDKTQSATNAANDPARWQRLVNDSPRQPLYSDNDNDATNTRESQSTAAAATINSTSRSILPPQPTSSAAALPTTTCPTYKAAIYSLVFVILFQIGLCLIAGCVGISVIWCAMAGWMVLGLFLPKRVRQQRNERTSSSSLSWFSRQTSSRTVAIVITTLFLDSVGIVYYAMTSELITTVAHACALALGAAVYKCTTSCGFTTGRRDCDYGTASTA